MTFGAPKIRRPFSPIAAKRTFHRFPGPPSGNRVRHCLWIAATPAAGCRRILKACLPCPDSAGTAAIHRHFPGKLPQHRSPHFRGHFFPEIKRLFQPANCPIEERVEHLNPRAFAANCPTAVFAGKKSSFFHQKPLAGKGSLLA